MRQIYGELIRQIAQFHKANAAPNWNQSGQLIRISACINLDQSEPTREERSGYIPDKTISLCLWLVEGKYKISHAIV